MSTPDHQLPGIEDGTAANDPSSEGAGGLVGMLQGLIEAARTMIVHSRTILSQLDHPRKPPLN
jgi:hypothetical protein